MHPFPHHYTVTGHASNNGNVTLSSEGLDDIASEAPAEFGGPGGRWSPETLLTAAVADCFMLGFRAIANASKLPFTELSVNVVGVLDRDGRVMKFTEMQIQATLVVPEEVSHEKAEKLLEKAEESCLITNSMSAEIKLQTSVSTA